MMGDEFDIAIIGAGVSGAAIARKLSSYRISVALLEKCADVLFGVSKANSGIIHAGFHHPTTSLKARPEIRGNLMFEQLHNELNFPFKRLGILVVAFSYEHIEVPCYSSSSSRYIIRAFAHFCPGQRRTVCGIFLDR
jgi:glycerol-3-phosphate dehydrogenase